MLNSGSIVGLAANLDTEVGKVVMDVGLATRTEVDFCREQQKQASDPNQRSLADLLVENNFITINQAKRIRGQLDRTNQPAAWLSHHGQAWKRRDGNGL